MDRLVETRHVSAVDYRDVAVAGNAQEHDEPGRWLFLPQTSGGSVLLPGAEPGQPGRLLYWQLHNHTTSTLTLAEVSLEGGHVGRGVRLHIPGQVFPALAHHSGAEGTHLFLLLSSRSVGVLWLPALAAAAAQQQQQQQQRGALGRGGGAAASGGSVLDVLRPGSLQQVPLAQQLAGLGSPTAVAAADGHLCVGGSEGGVACLPLAALAAGQAPPPHAVLHLNPTNLITQVRRRMGFASCGAVVAAVPVPSPAAAAAGADPGAPGAATLLVVYGDATCHQWHVAQGRQGLSATLAPDAAARQLEPTAARLCSLDEPDAGAPPPRRGPGWDSLLVWGMGAAGGGGQSDVRVLPLKRAAAAGGRLEQAAAQPAVLQLEWADARLLDARLCGQQLLLVVGTKAGAAHVVSYSCKDWSYLGRCQTLQQRASGGWGLQEELWACALEAFAGSTSPADHVLGQLLVPGQLCLSSLRQALSFHGTLITEQEAAGASLAQLSARIRATAELVSAKCPSYPAARCWLSIFHSYCEFWQQQHSVLGLYSGAGGWVGALRAGGVLTVLRRPTPAEVLLRESNPAALEALMQAVGASGASGIPGGAAALAKVRLCLAALAGVLGEAAMRVMTQLVMAGVPVEGELLPKVVALVLDGPPVAPEAPTGAVGLAAPGRQQRLAEWRAQRQARLLSVHEQLAELPHALETLSGVADFTIKSATAAAAELPAAAELHDGAGAGGSSGPPRQLGALLCGVALHSARAACMALQQLLLLLGCLRQLGYVGSTQLTSGEQGGISTDLIPPLATALRSTAVALWLCKTPASAPVAGAPAPGAAAATPMPGPLLGLRNPTPSGTPAGTPRGGADGGLATPAFAASQAAGGGGAGGSAAAAGAPHWHSPLAAHLLPQFWQQQGGSAGASAGAAGAQLAAWLVLGGGGSAGGAGAAAAAAQAAVTSAQALAGRGVLLGYQLFACREYAAMRRLVALIGGRDPSEPGLQFTLGLSIACGVKAAAGGGGQRAAAAAAAGAASADAPALESAVGHLFRAAAGLCGAEAAPLRLVLRMLRQRQGGGGSARQRLLAPPPGAGLAAADGDAEMGEADAGGGGAERARAEARLRLEFCEAVMLLFEREGVTEGALAFARAALGAADAAYSPDDQEAKTQQQAALWNSVFNCACELGLTHDAYTAALACPLPERAAEAVRRLVQLLLDRGELQQLLSLPWAGVLTLSRDGLPEPVPVVELVTAKLERRALHGDLALRPCPYAALFDFLVARGSFKHAAAAMLSYARRLRADRARRGGAAAEAEAAEAVRDAYDASVAALQLLAPDDAWLDPDQPLLAPYPAPPPLGGGGGAPAAPAGLRSLGALAAQLPAVLLCDLRREAELFSASALLLRRLPGLEVWDYGLSPGYLVDQLLGGQQYTAALRLAHALWGAPAGGAGAGGGGRLAAHLEAAVAGLAAGCARLQAGAGELEAAGGGAQALAGHLGSYTGPGCLGSPAAAAWHKLRQLLAAYDGDGATDSGGGGSNANGGARDGSVGELGGRLRLAAADGALGAAPGLQLPAWLLAPFQPREGVAGGMAGGGADPAALLRLLVKHGRLLDAARLAAEHLDAWQRQGPLLRAQPAASWLPLHDLELLHASLSAGAARAAAAERRAEAEALGTWREVLESALASHVALARSDADKLGAPGAAQPQRGLGVGGAVGMVF